MQSSFFKYLLHHVVTQHYSYFVKHLKTWISLKTLNLKPVGEYNTDKISKEIPVNFSAIFTHFWFKCIKRTIVYKYKNE